MFRTSTTLLASLLFASCAVTADDSAVDELAEPEESTLSSEIISSCYDWNGTCTGLPEGAACGNNGTCFADTYGVAGWCTCWEPPPPVGFVCPSGNSCAGLSEGSSCRKSNGSYGTCISFSWGMTNAPTACGCL